MATSEVAKSDETPKANLDTFDENDLIFFYKHFFPTSIIFNWFTYGGTRPFCNREIAFSDFQERFERWKSFSTPKSFEDDLIKCSPAKIHIGAHYNCDVRMKSSTPNAREEQKELVFDIDANDYDNVRICPCRGKPTVCSICWGLLEVAMHVIDRCLRDDFGFQHIIWVFSGRRGVHGWVCDEGARTLKPNERDGVVRFISVEAGTLESPSKLHPSLDRSYIICKEYFEKLVKHEGLMKNQHAIEQILTFVPYKYHADFKEIINSIQKSEDRWNEFKRYCDTIKDPALKEAKVKIIFHFTYPRLDVNVTKQWNHLLKCPLSIHPGTRKVCVPITCKAVTQNSSGFKPEDAPSIHELKEELDQAVSTQGATLTEAWKFTSFKKYIDIFNEFLIEGTKARSKNRTESLNF